MATAIIFLMAMVITSLFLKIKKMANRNYPKTLTATTAIPFDNPISAIPPKTITGATTFTKVTANAQVGYGAIIRVTADGTNTPDLSAFKKIGSGSYDNTNGVVNQLWFVYDGVDYCVSITHPETIISGGGGDTTPPTMVSATAIDANTIEVVFSESVTPTVAGWSYYITETSTTSSFSSVTGSGTTWQFTGVEAMSAGQTLKISYTSTTGNTLDGSGNELATFSLSSVTNSIGGGGSFPTTGRVGLWRKADIEQTGGLVTNWPEATGNGIDWTPAVGEEPAFDSDSTVLGAAGKNLKYTSVMNTTTAYTAYFKIKKTAHGGSLLGGASGYTVYMDGSGTYTKPDGGGSFQLNASVVANMGTYKVLCMVIHGGSTASELYLDGVLTGTFNTTSLGATRDFEKLLGESGANFIGNLECFAVFNGAHTGSEVATNSPLLETA